MAPLTPDAVNASRTLAVWLMRSVSVVLLAVGAYLMLKRIAFGFGVGNFQSALGTWTEIGEGHSFYRGIAMILVGAALGLSATRIARWALPVPIAGCPACGYEQAATAMAAGRCPECGLAGVNHPPSDRTPDRP